MFVYTEILFLIDLFKGLTKEDLQEKEIKPLSMNQLVESTGPGASVQVNKNELNDSLDNITYIECEVENELADSTDKLNSNNNNNNNPNTSSSIKLNKHGKELILNILINLFQLFF